METMILATFVLQIALRFSFIVATGPPNQNPIEICATNGFPDKRIVQVASSESFNCFLHYDSSVSCIGGAAQTHLIPAIVNSTQALPAIIELSAGTNHFCAHTTQYEVYCFGSNDHFQLGSATKSDTLVRVGVDGTALIARTVVAGGLQTCAIDFEDNVICWGMLSIGAPDERAVTKLQGLPKVGSLAVGYSRSCALTLDQELWCWGLNAEGAPLGVENAESPILPSRIVLPDKVISVGAGLEITCAILDTNEVNCWGKGGFIGTGDNTPLGGQIGDMASLPAIAFPAGHGSPRSVQVAREKVCVVFQSGALFCFADTNHGLAGNGVTSINKIGDEPNEMGEFLRETPTKLFSHEGVGVIVMTSLGQGGERTQCSIWSDLLVRCWGSNRDRSIFIDDPREHVLSPGYPTAVGCRSACVADEAWCPDKSSCQMNLSACYCTDGYENKDVHNSTWVDFNGTCILALNDNETPKTDSPISPNSFWTTENVLILSVSGSIIFLLSTLTIIKVFMRRRTMDEVPNEVPNTIPCQYFISYHVDSAGAKAQLLRETLIHCGVTVWLDKYQHTIDAKSMKSGISKCQRFLLFLTLEALDSPWVRRELLWAQEFNKPIDVVFSQDDNVKELQKKIVERGDVLVEQQIGAPGDDNGKIVKITKLVNLHWVKYHDEPSLREAAVKSSLVRRLEETGPENIA